ncbi:MAG: MgtC/SapB family protein [Burkholderiaceae bacterium]
MKSEYIEIATHLIAAIVAGSVIGLERSFHGRPAGFRTHTLVCLSSSLLMLVTMYQSTWLPGMSNVILQTDPTRMAQGIMTGIGFLGAGVIYKEHFSVRGLTTAASIWITAAIGILIGIGFYFPAILATALTLGILSVFRFAESRMVTESYAQYAVCFDRHDVMPEEELRDLLAEHDFGVANIGYRILHDRELFEYHMVIKTTDPSKMGPLAEKLRNQEKVREFRIEPSDG